MTATVTCLLCDRPARVFYVALDKRSFPYNPRPFCVEHREQGYLNTVHILPTIVAVHEFDNWESACRYQLTKAKAFSKLQGQYKADIAKTLSENTG